MELRAYVGEISLRVAAGETHDTISISLQGRNPHRRGFSCRSLRCLCSSEDIHFRSGLSDLQLDQMVSGLVQAVGHSYGRRMIHGLLSSQGIHVSQRRLSRSMSRVAPGPQLIRMHTARRHLNPPLYSAHFFGDILHLDQNEKLAMYGVTHVMAVDGFSCKSVGCITIPVKNAITIYDTLMRPLLSSTGLWQQVRVDHRTEFVLVLKAQQHLSHLRQWQDRLPALQSTSCQNHRVERMWPEVNQRINYPVKRVLVEMESNGEIDMADPIVKFCVSWTTITVIQPAVLTFVNAWNSHTIPGGGVPNVLASHTVQLTRLLPSAVPTTSNIVQLHQMQGGTLTEEHVFGTDPLDSHPELQDLRERDFFQMYPSMEVLFQDVLHSNGSIFRSAMHYFKSLTISFCSLIEGFSS